MCGVKAFYSILKCRTVEITKSYEAWYFSVRAIKTDYFILSRNKQYHFFIINYVCVPYLRIAIKI